MPTAALPETTRGARGADRRQGHSHTSLTYRPALDGLRGIAVLAVFVYHAQPSVLRGGWLGVDTFFVLSGYLITALLLTEHHRWGWISFGGFWLARARRLLPALVIVLVAVLLASWQWAATGRRGPIALDATATLVYVANWRYLFSNEAYFAAIANPSPLRHTWSLAVEEQFYILFPILLVGLLGWLGRRRVPLAIALGAAASALWMAHLHVPGIDPSRVYYGTDVRAQQLLVGAFLASLLAPGAQTTRHTRRLVDRWCRRLAPVALVGVLLSVVLVSEATPTVFEGGLLLFSVVVGCIVVAAASPNPSLTSRLLSVQPLRRLGLISYGVYLWHWPVIVFLTPDRLGIGGVLLTAIHATITVGLATASYLLVERPIRYHGVAALIPERAGWGRAVSIGAVICLAVLTVALPRTTLASGQSMPGLAYTSPAYQPRNPAAPILLIGNSVPDSLVVTMPQGIYTDLQVVKNTNLGCDPVPVPKVVDGVVSPVTQDCIDWRATWIDSVTQSKPALTVVFAAHTLLNDFVVDGTRLEFGSAGHDEFLRQSWSQTTERIRAAGSPRVAFVNLACHRLPDLGTSDETTRTNDDALVAHLNALLHEWATMEDVPIIDQHGFLCTGGYHDTINGLPLYADALHFTEESGPIMWSWLAPQLQALSS